MSNNSESKKPGHAPGYVPNPDYTQDDWDEVCDDPESTDDDFRRAVPFREAFPDLYASLTKDREAVAAGRKIGISMTLDADIVARFKATGPGWEARMSEALRRAADALPPA